MECCSQTSETFKLNIMDLQLKTEELHAIRQEVQIAG